MASRIRHWREQAGLSRRRLAALVSVTPPTVTFWEQGVNQPTMENLGRIADACGVSLQEFFGALPGCRD